MISVTQF